MGLDVILAKDRGVICMGDAEAAVEAAPRFDLLVFCAEEFQPLRDLMIQSAPRATLCYAPNIDGELPRERLAAATQAAALVANRFLRGQKILVTCLEGRNRSGLVIALALHMLSGAGGAQVAKFIRARRRHVAEPALTNPFFMKLLENIPPRKSGPRGVPIAV